MSELFPRPDQPEPGNNSFEVERQTEKAREDKIKREDAVVSDEFQGIFTTAPDPRPEVISFVEDIKDEELREWYRETLEKYHELKQGFYNSYEEAKGRNSELTFTEFARSQKSNVEEYMQSRRK